MPASTSLRFAKLVSVSNVADAGGSALGESLKWAEAYAEGIDPVARLRDEIVNVQDLPSEPGRAAL